MLTRLKVNGFKNLVDFDLYLGPLTCIGGENGVGKSNIFDAIHFLSLLADHTLLDAAQRIRAGGRKGDPRQLFQKVGDAYGTEMQFEVEMLVPPQGIDDLGQEVEASSTFLSYRLRLGLTEGSVREGLSRIEILEEELLPIQRKDASSHVHFPHSAKLWREPLISPERTQGSGERGAPYLSTTVENHVRIVRLHQEGAGQPRPLLLQKLPRTWVSTATGADGPTIALARQEMRSWRNLQLEPSQLSNPSEFLSPSEISVDGANLASTLYRIAQAAEDGGLEFHLRSPLGSTTEARAYTQVANLLSGLIDDVKSVWVERDEARQLLTLFVSDRSGNAFPASSLSDGTLRFLALAILAIDPKHEGLLCLEEPENGLHPTRMPAMMRLLQKLAVRPKEQSGEGNPNRQILFNTHSPQVVENTLEDDLVLVYSRRKATDRKGESGGVQWQRVLEAGCMSGTWRDSKHLMRVAPLGRVMDYLELTRSNNDSGTARRIVDREDVQLSLGFDSAA